ncbi:MAG: cbb3-type cytochrome c oxidase subunit II [Cypionkella sp.]|nr:cbb3-type cytochrome c oxidase subunit II [Cypionkella sp.]
MPESVMPKYSYLFRADVDGKHIAQIMSTHALVVGVPYTSEMIENAVADFDAQGDPNADTSGLEERYGKVTISNYDGQPQLTGNGCADCLSSGAGKARWWTFPPSTRPNAIGGRHGYLQPDARICR